MSFKYKMSRQNAEFHKETILMMFPDASVEIKESFGSYLFFRPEPRCSIEVDRDTETGECSYGITTNIDLIGFVAGWLMCQFDKDLTEKEISSVKLVMYRGKPGCW